MQTGTTAGSLLEVCYSEVQLTTVGTSCLSEEGRDPLVATIGAGNRIWVTQRQSEWVRAQMDQTGGVTGNEVTVGPKGRNSCSGCIICCKLSKTIPRTPPANSGVSEVFTAVPGSEVITVWVNHQQLNEYFENRVGITGCPALFNLHSRGSSAVDIIPLS